jgi:hypothetical protein
LSNACVPKVDGALGVAPEVRVSGGGKWRGGLRGGAPMALAASIRRWREHARAGKTDRGPSIGDLHKAPKQREGRGTGWHVGARATPLVGGAGRTLRG